MDLRGTELVVLSACETGLGDVQAGEGVYGLRRAFQYAGARTIISTLFAIPSAKSRQLMKSFYAKLKVREKKRSALHAAQLEIMKAQKRAGASTHPFFWAGFILSGDPE